MQRGPLAGEQLGVDGLLDQRVPEGVALAGVAGDQDGVADCQPERVDEVAGRLAGHGGEQVVVDMEPGRGGDPQDGLGRLGKLLDAGHEQVAQRRWERTPATRPVPPGQLLDEERVALRAGEHLVDQVGIGPLAQDGGELVGNLVPFEAGQLDALGPAPLQLGQDRAQRVAAVQLVGAERGDQDDPGPAQVAGQEGEQVQRGAVGPVHVLEGEQERPLGPEPLDQAEDQLEQAALGGVVGGAG